jgi:hypothetical protein
MPEDNQPTTAPPGCAPTNGSEAYDSFQSALESGDVEHLLWWRDAARKLIEEVMWWHSDHRCPEYNECDKAKCMWCENAAKLLPSNSDYPTA